MKKVLKKSAAVLTIGALSASAAKAAPIAYLQVLGSTTGNAGTYTNSLSGVTGNQTIFIQLNASFSPIGTVNNGITITAEANTGNATTSDGFNSQGYTLTGVTGSTFSNAALVNGFAGGNGVGAGTPTNNQLLNAYAAQASGNFSVGLVETAQLATTSTGTGSVTVSMLSSDTGGGINFNNGSQQIFTSTSSASGSGGQSSNDPYLGFTALTLNPTALAWDGTASNSWDKTASHHNWTNGTAGYSDGSAVTFGDTAADGTTPVQNTGNISIVSGGVQPTSVTFTNTNTAYRFTNAGFTGNLTTTPGKLTIGISGDGSVTINGGGTVAFSSPNLYSGGTFITSGVLKAAPSSLNAAGPVTIGASGKLFVGDGSSPMPSTLATGAETWTGGGALAAKVDPNGTSDQLTVGGIVTLGGAGAFTIPLQPGDVALGTPAGGTTWQIATFGSLSNYVGTLPSGSGVANGVPVNAQFTLDTTALGVSNANFTLDLVELSTGGDGLDVVYATAPEPTTAVLVLGAIAPMLLGRRRRNRSAAEATA